MKKNTTTPAPNLSAASRKAVATALGLAAVALSAAALTPEGAALKETIQARETKRLYEFTEILQQQAVPAADFVIKSYAREGTPLHFAANELSQYLSRVVNTEIPVVAETTGGKVIHIEVADAQPEEGISAELTDGENLYIRGNSPRAALYAVYDFLEKACGVRFFAPFEYGEVVPLQPDLRFPLFKDSDQPALSYRSPHYCSYGRRKDAAEHRWIMADWTVKNRFNVELERIQDREAIKDFYAIRGGIIWLMENSGHNFHKLIPPAKYFEKHPEFFCFDRATGEWRAQRAQLCTTNPNLVAELGRLADSYFERHPDQKYFPLFQEDGARLWCQCPPCLALNPDGSNLESTSENNINLANLVCAEIRTRHPDKGVCTYAYSVSRKPPVNVKPIEGVRVMYCYYSDGDPTTQPWEAGSLREMLEWSRLTKGDMILYSYHYLSPRYTFNDEYALANLFKTMNVLGIEGTHQESGETWGGIDGYLLYAGSRLAWNPWYDEAAFKDDYFSKMFAAAKAPMRAFHDLLSDNLTNSDNRLRMGFNTYPALPTKVTDHMRALIAEARQAVTDDRRANAAITVQERYLRYLEDWSELMRSGDKFYSAPTREGYDKAKADLQTLDETMREISKDRVISMNGLRIITAFTRGFDDTWRQERTRLELVEKYDVLQTLNPWRFRTDPESLGDERKWFAADFDDSSWDSIESGKFWEDQGYDTYDGAAWYRMELEVPAADAPIGLYFAGADERAWVYFNGEYIGGQHEGDVGILWRQPFTVMLPPNTAAGKYTLAVRVVDSGGKGGLWDNVLLIREK